MAAAEAIIFNDGSDILREKTNSLSMGAVEFIKGANQGKDRAQGDKGRNSSRVQTRLVGRESVGKRAKLKKCQSKDLRAAKRGGYIAGSQ